MSHIVILGAGANGLSMAYEMRDLARAGDRITVVANDARFHSALGPWEAPRTGPDGDIAFALGPRLEKKGIGFTAAGARRLHPEENRLELGDGANLDYDFLVIAAGPKLAFSEIEGLGPGGYTHAVCHVDQAVIASEAWERFVADPGPIVVGAAPGATCFAPAYQLALAIESDLHRRGIRSRVDMSFVTAEPHIGHLGLGEPAECRTLLESALRRRNIRWIANARVTRVEAGRMHVSEGDAGGAKQEHVLAFKYSVMLPACRSIDAIAGIDGLVNQCGFVLIDDYLRNPRYGNIYAVGVSVAPAAPAPPGTARIGCTLESVATAAANNIRAQLDGGAPTHKPIWNALSVADLGAAGIGFVERPHSAGGDSFPAGGWVHLPQCACCEGGGGELPPAQGASRAAA